MGAQSKKSSSLAMKLVDIFNVAPGYKCREGQKELYFEQKENCQHQHKGMYLAFPVKPKVFWDPGIRQEAFH